MTSKKNTRRALFTSIMSLILCFAMLMGTTFAWFTDSVSSGMNQIAAGNLDVALYHNGNEPVTTNTKLFDDITRWEPGAVVYENLVVKNEGNLALQYQLALTFTNATKSPKNDRTLADVLKVAVVEGGFNGGREIAKTLNYNQSLSTFTLRDNLATGQSSKTYGVVIYWQPGTNDNDFNMNNNAQGQVLSIDLGVSLFATQTESEQDSFDETYDKEASLEMPEVTVETPTTDAFLAALARGETAKLTADMVLETNGTIPANTTAAIDLNGHTLTLGKGGISVNGGLIITNGVVSAVAGEDDLSFAFTVSNGGALEIDSNAKIDVSESGAAAALMYGGNLDVDGTIETVSGSCGVFTMNSNCDIDINGNITGEGTGINQQGGTTNVTVDGTLGNSVLGATGTMNLTYSGEQPTITVDTTSVTLNIRKATGFDGIYQDPSNAKSYTIDSKTGLKNLYNVVSANPGEGLGDTVTLTADIDMSGEVWQAVDTMWMTFNGNGHTISNLNCAANDNGRSGLFAYAGGVTIKNLTLKNVTATGSQVGTFFASAEGSNLENCILTGSNTVTYSATSETYNGIGALIGWNTAVSLNKVQIAEGATVTLNVGSMTSAGTKHDNLTGYGSAPSGYVTNKGSITVNKDSIVRNSAELTTAINEATNGSTVTLNAGNYSMPTLSAKEGMTIIGEEGTVIIGDSGTGFASNFGKNTTIKNITFVGSNNGVRGSYANGGTSTFDNCTFKGDSTYGFHIDESKNATFVFNNCTFIGFNAFAGDLESVTFNNCTFLHNGNYGHTNIWSTAYFNNCTWGDKTSVSCGGDGGTLYFNDVEESYHHEFIGSSASLKAFADSVNNEGDTWSNQKVLLVADIDLENIDWEPIGQAGATEFKGTFDGQNYTIKNLNVNSVAETGEHYSSGLFGWAESAATIQNVKIDGAKVVGNHNVAVLVGYTSSNKISNCHITNASVTCKHANDDACGDKCGLIVGYAGDKSRINNCSASNSTVTAGRDAGQLIGAGYNVSISGCSAANVAVGAGGDCTGANVNAAIIGRVLG